MKIRMTDRCSPDKPKDRRQPDPGTASSGHNHDVPAPDLIVLNEHPERDGGRAVLLLLVA
jgi:hypothetical protein